MDVRSTSLRRSEQAILASGMDIRVWGLLFVVSGIVDLTWIFACPAYDLNNVQRLGRQRRELSTPRYSLDKRIRILA